MIANIAPSVWLSPRASPKTKHLWSLHGGPNASRYTDPELTSLAALLRYNANNFGAQVAFLYPERIEGSHEYISITWGEFDRWTAVLAGYYSRKLEAVIKEANQIQKQPTVALLGGGFTFEYFATQMALQKLNIRVLLVAPQTSSSAIQHLVNVTEVKATITDKAHVDLECLREMPIIPLVEEVGEIQGEFDSALTLTYVDQSDAWERHTFIIHSSGSTGVPKPITHTNRSLMMIAKMYRLFPEFHIENWFLLFPLFHIAGLSIILSGLPNGMITSLPPRFWPPSSSNVLRSWEKLADMGYPVECLHCAPVLIENLIDYIEHNGGDFKPLSNLKVLQPGGAMLANSLILKLVSHGVNVKTTYGSTEIGAPLRSIPHSRGNTECYRFANLFPNNKKIEMQDLGDGFYECIIHKGFEFAADLWGNEKDTAPYRTNDLFVQSPANSGYFFLEGRKDDFLIHTTGENTNANAIETTLKGASSHIKRVVMLGHGRISPCLLVEADVNSQEVQAEIMKSIKETNSLYPKHSAVLPQLVYFLEEGQLLPITPKGNVKRKEAENLYIGEIQRLYERLQEGTEQTDNTSVTNNVTKKEDLIHIIRKAISDLCHRSEVEINEDSSFYSLGLDSLSAIKLRLQLFKLIGPLSMNDIFENPSINGLTEFFQRKATGTERSNQAKHKEFMQSAIEKHSAQICVWNKVSPPVEHQSLSVLLTGTSGSLGTALLEKLAGSTRIRKIYALVHGNKKEQKIQDSMRSRGIDYNRILSTGKIEILNYDMKDSHLGLSDKIYNRLASEVTSVVHGAWVMDFNRVVEDFEEDCLVSVMNMIRFCSTGPTKTFGFVSSVSTNMGSSARGAIQEVSIGLDLDTALQTGYAQSKYIAERICQVASKHLNLPVKVLRLGQMYGHSVTGAWNVQEMFPIMIATSLHLGAVPVFPPGTSVDWIPVDIAAATMYDILTSTMSAKNAARNASAPDSHLYTTHNIVNPYPITWRHFLVELKSALDTSLNTIIKLEDVSMKDWVALLNGVAHMNDRGFEKERDEVKSSTKYTPTLENGSALQVPGLKLLGFFEDMAKESVDIKFDVCHQTSDVVPGVSSRTLTCDTNAEQHDRYFDTSRTRCISPALATCTPVNRALLTLCVDWWKSQNFVGTG